MSPVQHGGRNGEASQPPHGADNENRYLDSLSNLAGQSFASIQAMTEAILKLVVDCVGLRTSYLTQFSDAEALLEVLAAYNAPGGCDVQAGERIPLPTAYCREIITSAQPVPVLIGDTHSNPPPSRAAPVAAFPTIGSYVGVPILLSDAQVFGTLCAVDPEARTLTRQQADLLVVLARILATQLERDREVHERTLVEQALRESEGRYRSLVQFAPDAIAVLRGSKVLYLNPAGVRLLGARSTDELIGRSIAELVHPDHLDRVMEYIQQVRERGQYVPPSEEQLLRVDGTPVPVEVVALPILYEGEPAGQVIARDISQRKQVEAQLAAALAEQRQANAQLERLNAAKSHFVSIVSHEFRTALTGIQGFSEMMRDEEFTLEEMKEFATDINEDARRLNRMITELLDLDRMESGQMTLNLQLVHLNPLVVDVASARQRNAPTHPIRLQLDPTLPPLMGDRDKLLQVMTNLVSNAVKYSPNGGEITLTTEQGDGMVHVAVQDQGVGIAPGETDTIFERFRRSQSGAARYIPGTGLGLPIVRQIVELHGGTVWVESVLGEGSTFHFTIPFKAQTRA